MYPLTHQALEKFRKIMIADSWFGSVKSAVQLYEQNGLYSIMLMLTAHKSYPSGQLGSPVRGKLGSDKNNNWSWLSISWNSN